MQNRHQFTNHQLAGTLQELAKITANHDEGAVACLCLYMLIMQDRHPERSLQELADNARLMIMSFEDRPGTLQ